MLCVEDILSSISAMELMWEPLHAKLKSEVSLKFLFPIYARIFYVLYSVFL